MDSTFWMAIAVWVSGAGFGWLWRHYSWRHARAMYDHGWHDALDAYGINCECKQEDRHHA